MRPWATPLGGVVAQLKPSEPLYRGRCCVTELNSPPELITTWRDKGRVVSGTNVERMASGRAPIGTDGYSVNLHHMTQDQGGAIAEMTQSFHQINGGVIHINPSAIPSGIDRNSFSRWREKYWIDRYKAFGEK